MARSPLTQASKSAKTARKENFMKIGTVFAITAIVGATVLPTVHAKETSEQAARRQQAERVAAQIAETERLHQLDMLRQQRLAREQQAQIEAARRAAAQAEAARAGDAATRARKP